MAAATLSGESLDAAASIAKELLADLGQKLSPNAKVVAEGGDNWEELLKRWTDLGTKTPAGIVCISTEDDIVEAVKLCHECHVPFVPKAGGSSSWSTIGRDGFIIDLTDFNGVEIDKISETMTVQGGAPHKAAISALSEAGFCAALGNAGTVGLVPHCLNGGISFLNGLLGFGSDAIVAARMVTASGELINISETENHELLYALKGAGQHFGLVTSLTLRIAPVSILNSDDGTIWMVQAVFAAAQVPSLIKAFEPVANDPNPRQAGLVMITKDPMGSGSTIALCVLYYLGSTSDALTHFGSLKENEPLVWAENRVPFGLISQGFEAVTGKGGYKRLRFAGLPRFPNDANVWEKEVAIFDQMVETCGPDAGAGPSGIAFEWVGQGEPGRFEESAYGHQRVRTWVETMAWYTDAKAATSVEQWEAEALKLATTGFEEEEVETYQNFSRDTSIESRFPGAERQRKLKALKAKWDPEGVFTKVFLQDV